MKKKLLLLSTILMVSASSIFAQTIEVPSDDNNITYTYTAGTDVEIIAEGQSSADDFNNVYDIEPTNNSVKITYVGYTKTVNRTRKIKLTVSKVTNTSNLPSVLAEFSRPATSEVTYRNLGTKWNDFVQRNTSSKKYELLNTTTAQEKYKTYEFTCEKAILEDENIKKGIDLIEEDIQTDAAGYKIHQDLYYSDLDWMDKWTLITRTSGSWKEGNTYENCTDIYVPTSVKYGTEENEPRAPQANSTGENGVCSITGLVDVAAFNSLMSAHKNDYLNFDFTTANIVGTIKSSNVSDNHLAYFVAEANAEGDNIINGTNCENYKLADDETEIKVYKAFTAKNIVYTRNITAGKYYTITVPFDFQGKTDYFNRTSTFTSCDIVGNNTKVKFTLTDNWEANMPMLCKANTTASFMSLSNLQGIQVKKSEAKSWSGEETSSEPAKFNGNYVKKPKVELADAWIVGLDGTFGRMPVNSTQLKPGRAYITLDKNSAAKLDNAIVEFVDEDGTVEVLEANSETTGIDGVTDSSDEAVVSQFVTIDGKASTTPVKGLNIVKSTLKNGQTATKKVIY